MPPLILTFDVIHDVDVPIRMTFVFVGLGSLTVLWSFGGLFEQCIFFGKHFRFFFARSFYHKRPPLDATD